MNRRFFLHRTLYSSLLLAGSGAVGLNRVVAIEPLRRAGTKPRLLLGLAAYSFREFLPEASPRREKAVAPAKRMDLFGFVDFCAEQDCQGAELTSYYFPAKVDRDFLLRLRHHAFNRGVEICGSAVGNTFTHPTGADRDKEIAHVKQWIDHAFILGAPHIRVFAGNPQKDQSLAEAKRLCIESLEECCEYAGQHGVVLGIENHGGISAEASDLLDVVRAVRSPWCGINLDTGNFHTDDPYGDLAKCAPYAVNVQVKEEISARGKKKERADFQRLIRILRDASYQGYVTLEYESAPDPWEAVPKLLQELRALMTA